MEKKLITWEWFQDEVCLESCDYYDVYNKRCCREANKIACDIWNNLETYQEKVTILPANGSKRNGCM